MYRPRGAKVDLDYILAKHRAKKQGDNIIALPTPCKAPRKSDIIAARSVLHNLLKSYPVDAGEVSSIIQVAKDIEI
jgi:hypothetical protein